MKVMRLRFARVDCTVCEATWKRLWHVSVLLSDMEEKCVTTACHTVVVAKVVFFCRQVKSAVENCVCHNMVYKETLQNQLCMIGTVDGNVAQVYTVVTSDDVWWLNGQQVKLTAHVEWFRTYWKIYQCSVCMEIHGMHPDRWPSKK